MHDFLQGRGPANPQTDFQVCFVFFFFFSGLFQRGFVLAVWMRFAFLVFSRETFLGLGCCAREEYGERFKAGGTGQTSARSGQGIAMASNKGQ